jgi:putative ABC transport system permease protein
MARRDLRRHKGRAVLVFLMVAVPVGLIAGAATVGSTGQIDGRDLVTAQMGSGQALLTGPEPAKVFQNADATATAGYGIDGSVQQVPEYAAGQGAASNAKAISAVVGQPVVATQDIQLRFVVGERRVRIESLVIDPRTIDVGAKAHLTGGRWGATADEVVVTPAGQQAGIPTSGRVTISSGGTERNVTVVGTATAWGAFGGQPDLVMPQPPEGLTATDAMYGTPGWIVAGSKPVTWSEVLRLNGYGFTVISRAVLADPPSDSEIPQEVQAPNTFMQDTSQLIAVLGGVMLFIITTLLVGPAFAVSAARQRRTLALAATNGAEVRQLRRTVLAQALVLGVISALGGCALGLVAVGAGLRWWAERHPASMYASVPLDIPWTAMAILAPCAVLSAVVAALLPARRLGRLDVIGVMRGQSVSAPLNKVAPVIGLAVAGVGGLLVITGSQMRGGGDTSVGVGAVALVLGVLLLVPALLVIAGRLARRLPVGPRLATRDAARHRSRSTPTVAAILAGVAALTMGSIGLASDTAQQMATYRPQALPGEGTIFTGDTEAKLSVDATLRQFAGVVSVTPLLVVRGTEDPMAPPAPGTSQEPQPFVAAVANGCTVEQSLFQNGPDGKCVTLGTMAYDNGFIGVLPAAEIARRLQLGPSQRAALEKGAIVAATPALQKAPTVDVSAGTFVMDQKTYLPSQVRTTRTDTLPVVAVPTTERGSGSMPGQTGAFVTPQTATRLGWPTYQAMVLVHAPDGGAIDRGTEQQLDELVGGDGGLYVERGFQRYDQKVMQILMAAGAALVLIVTLISTALSLAEQQTDLGTLAAVGATRRTRRGFAAAQAVVTGLLGALLGLVVGLIPGLAIAVPLTTDYSVDPATGQEGMTGPYLVVPWLPLLLVTVGVPCVAGLIAAVAIRRAPTMTRRAG